MRFRDHQHMQAYLTCECVKPDEVTVRVVDTADANVFILVASQVVGAQLCYARNTIPSQAPSENLQTELDVVLELLQREVELTESGP